MDTGNEKRKYDLTDTVEVGIVIMAFVFALIFLFRLGETVVSKGLFQVQNATNLLVASLLSVFVLALFMKRMDSTQDLGCVRPYALGGGGTGISAYLLALFDLPPEGIWVCLAIGIMSLAFLTVHSVREKNNGAYRFTAGMWMVMIMAGAMGTNLIRTSNISGLLLFLALAGVFVGIFGLLEVIDHRRAVFDRFGYSASIYCLLLVWLSTSRMVASDALTGYTEIDSVMVGTGVVFGMLGASVLTQKRYLDSRVRNALADGHDSYKDGEYGTAIEKYDKALEVAPKSKVARTCKADALSQMKRYNEAIKVYDSVIREDKDYTPAISGKGSALRQKGELAKSVIYLQKALNIDPNSKIAWNNKGNAFFFLDQLKTSIFCYKKAIELDPEYSGAWYNLAVTHTNSGNFLEADHAFSTAANLLERLGKKPLLKGGRTDRRERSFMDTLGDLPQDVSLEILSGDMEKRVLSHVSFNPGCIRKEVMMALSLGEPEAKAVLAGLARSRLIDAKRDGAKFRYYPKEQLPVMIHVMEMEGAMVEERKVRYLTDFQKRLVEMVETKPGIKVKELAAGLKISQQVVEYHIKTMEKGGIIEGKRTGIDLGYQMK